MGVRPPAPKPVMTFEEEEQGCTCLYCGSSADGRQCAGCGSRKFKGVPLLVHGYIDCTVAEILDKCDTISDITSALSTLGSVCGHVNTDVLNMVLV